MVLEVMCRTSRRATMFGNSIDNTDENVVKRDLTVKTLRNTDDEVLLFSRVYLEGERHTFAIASHSHFDFESGEQEHHVKLLTSEGHHLHDFTISHELGVDGLLEAFEIERHLVNSLPAAEWHAECYRHYVESPPETFSSLLEPFAGCNTPADNR